MMVSKNFGNFSLAKDIKKTVEKIATDKVEQLRPALKTAVVDSINTVEKYCMVTYVGESLSVKVPYNNVAPSYVGQFVRVGGPANDRRIEEVLGQTDSEDRLAKIEDLLNRTAPTFGSWYRSANTTIGVSLVNVVWTDAAFTPLGFDPPSGADITIPDTGWYEMYAQVTTSGVIKDLYIQVTPISGAADYDIGRSNHNMSGDNFGITTNTMSTKKIVHLTQGDKVRVNIGSASTGYTLFGGPRTCFEIKRLIADPS